MYELKKDYIVGDFHCHTLASKHAYSTLRENMIAAKKKDLKLLGVTDHGIGTPDSPPLSYFENLTSLPAEAEGIILIRGVEANIMNHEGKLDMPESVLQSLDFVIASYHTSCTVPGTVDEHTYSYLKIAENPYVNLIGHSGSAEYMYDYKKVIPVFGRNKKVVEINAHTFICRQKSIENCRKIAEICAENDVRIMVNSDAHSEFEVGEVRRAFAMLNEIHFPEELIINTDMKRMKEYLYSIGIQREHSKTTKLIS